MDRQQIICQIAEEYISQCEINVDLADVKFLCSKYDYSDLGYASLNSMKAAVSKILRKKEFNKKKYTLNLVRSSYEKIVSVEDKAKDEIIKIIQKDLQHHNLKYKLVRDYLQEMELGVREHLARKNLSRFKGLIKRGHSYTYSVTNSDLTFHVEKKAKAWFIESHHGDERETLKTRRVNKTHKYHNLKDYILLSEDTDRISRIWTTIGFAFADGSVKYSSVALVITKSDSYYLSEYCIPALLDNSFENNGGPELIEAHSNKHKSSFDGSKPVARAHLEDSYLAAFLTEMGMPSNKINESINLSDKILSLPDNYFFCFIAGLFAGDGCITRQKKEHLHLDFDLHCEKFCNDLACQIESRLGVPMKVNSHLTRKGKKHFKLTASTNWRALSLLFAMYYYAPFHLKRKTKKADDYIDELIQAIPSYSFLKIRPGNLVNRLCSQEQLMHQLGLLKEKGINNPRVFDSNKPAVAYFGSGR